MGVDRFRIDERSFSSFVQAVATPGTGEALVATETWAVAVWVMAKRTDGNNTGDVYVGPSTTDKDSFQWMKLSPGDYWEIPIPAGTAIDLNVIYVDAETATDGVVGGYIPRTRP